MFIQSPKDPLPLRTVKRVIPRELSLMAGDVELMCKRTVDEGLRYILPNVPWTTTFRSLGKQAKCRKGYVGRTEVDCWF
jgi:hypothetical protein